MPNLGSMLKEEISRLSRKELRKHVEPLKKAVATFRRDNAALKRQAADLAREVARLTRQGGKATPKVQIAEGDADVGKQRFTAGGLRTQRARMGLSAPELAKLVGVSAQSIYNWETDKATPRRAQFATLVAMRGWGKREARAKLDEVAPPAAKKRRSKKA